MSRRQGWPPAYWRAADIGIGDRLVSAASDAASVVATDAALAVMAPVAMFDQQTGETDGNHLSNVGLGRCDKAGSTANLPGAPVRAMADRR